MTEPSPAEAPSPSLAERMHAQLHKPGRAVPLADCPDCERGEFEVLASVAVRYFAEMPVRGVIELDAPPTRWVRLLKRLGVQP